MNHERTSLLQTHNVLLQVSTTGGDHHLHAEMLPQGHADRRSLQSQLAGKRKCRWTPHYTALFIQAWYDPLTESEQWSELEKNHTPIRWRVPLFLLAFILFFYSLKCSTSLFGSKSYGDVPWMVFSFVLIFWRVGIRYAPVFPVPFFARARMSEFRLLMASGIDCSWIGLGRCKFSSHTSQHVRRKKVNINHKSSTLTKPTEITKKSERSPPIPFRIYPWEVRASNQNLQTPSLPYSWHPTSDKIEHTIIKNNQSVHDASKQSSQSINQGIQFESISQTI